MLQVACRDAGSGTVVACLPDSMNALLTLRVRHPEVFRWAWLGFLLLLAACNYGDNSGSSSGGGGGY
jgi:hypothetical protein